MRIFRKELKILEVTRSEKKEIVKWINCAKCVAILAVLLDHTHKILFTNEKIEWASYFSVSLFVLISGITTYKTRAKNLALNGFRAYWQKVFGILTGYLIATILYTIAEYGYFDFETFMDLLIHFNASGPLYFVLLYLQLMLIHRPLLYFLEKNRKLQVFYEMILLVIVVIFASYSVKYTNIMHVYGGGGKLFGATYLILFYVGMLLEKYVFSGRDFSIGKSLICMVSFGILWLTWWQILCEKQFALEQVLGNIFGVGLNPPGVTLMISAMFMLFLCFGLFTWLERSNIIGRKLVELVNYIGCQSMYIFLFHRLILDYFLVKYVHFESRWLMRGCYLICMIVGSIMIGGAVELFTKFIKNISLPTT